MKESKSVKAKIIFDRLLSFLRDKGMNLNSGRGRIVEYTAEKYKIAFKDNSYRGTDHSIMIFKKGDGDEWILCLTSKASFFGCSTDTLNDWTTTFNGLEKELVYFEHHKHRDEEW